MRSTRSKMVTSVIALAVLLAVSAGYYRIGWDRMESSCSADRPGESTPSGAQYDWSWNPLGFRCKFDDGTSRTSLMF